MKCRTGEGVGISADERSPKRLYFAVATMVSAEPTFHTYQHLVKRICRDVGREEAFVLRPSYADVRQALEENQVDVAFVCTGTYVHGLERGRIKLLVQPEFQDGLQYRSVFIVPIGSSVKNLKDLRGLTMAFTDPESNTGRIVPCVILAQQGWDPKTFFKKLVFTGSHDRSIQAVALGTVDVAAVDSLVWESAKQEDQSLSKRVRVIWESEAFGPPPIVVPRDMDSGLEGLLLKSFLALHKDKEGHDILSDIGIKRFVPAREEDYRSAKEMYVRFRNLGDL